MPVSMLILKNLLHSAGFFDIWFSEGLVAIVMVIELYRRCLWNLFRVENENINNPEMFFECNDQAPLPSPPAPELGYTCV